MLWLCAVVITDVLVAAATTTVVVVTGRGVSHVGVIGHPPHPKAVFIYLLYIICNLQLAVGLQCSMYVQYVLGRTTCCCWLSNTYITLIRYIQMNILHTYIHTLYTYYTIYR